MTCAGPRGQTADEMRQVLPDGGLYVQAVVHDAYVLVDEQGTEAAAATGTSMTTLSADANPTVRAAPPYRFFVRDDVYSSGTTASSGTSTRAS